MHGDAAAELDAGVPVERLHLDRGIGPTHCHIVAKRGDHARGKVLCEPRQRRDIEMIVVPVRDQHDVDLRQLLERDAGIVVPLRPRPADRREPHRPDGIDHDVEAAGLDQPAGMADEGEPQPIAVDPRRRGVGMGTGGPIRPFRALPLAIELPAQHLAERFRRHAVRIDDVQAVEMVGDRAVIGFHAGYPEGGHADQRAGPGKQSERRRRMIGTRRVQRWLERQDIAVYMGGPGGKGTRRQKPPVFRILPWQSRFGALTFLDF